MKSRNIAMHTNGEDPTDERLSFKTRKGKSASMSKNE